MSGSVSRCTAHEALVPCVACGPTCAPHGLSVPCELCACDASYDNGRASLLAALSEPSAELVEACARKAYATLQSRTLSWDELRVKHPALWQQWIDETQAILRAAAEHLKGEGR